MSTSQLGSTWNTQHLNTSLFLKAQVFTTLPNDSKARIAYDDDDKCEEFNGSGIGERPHLIVCLLEWQTQNHPLSDAIENVITRLKALNTLQK